MVTQFRVNNRESQWRQFAWKIFSLSVASRTSVALALTFSFYMQIILTSRKLLYFDNWKQRPAVRLSIMGLHRSVTKFQDVILSTSLFVNCMVSINYQNLKHVAIWRDLPTQ